jgi:hypothetical protein
MMIRLYCSVAEGTAVTIELKSGQPIRGQVSWVRDQQAGHGGGQYVDNVDRFVERHAGPRPRMPRIETDCHAMLRDGANTLRVKVCDISQGGVKIACETIIPRGADVILTLPGVDPQPGIACWVEDGFAGISFNRLIPLDELVGWLQGQRETQRSAG